MSHPFPIRRHARPRLKRLALGLTASCIGLSVQVPMAGAAEVADASGSAVVVVGEKERRSFTTDDATVGSKTPASLREIPQSVSVMTRARLEEQNLTSLDEVMAQMPGVTVDLSGTGVIPAYYSRGYAVEYFQYDGVPIQTGGASWSQPDMLMFERVEMLRGAGGLFNGAGQPGGVINMMRKRPTEASQFTGMLGYGSWNNKRAEADYSTALTPGGTVRARVAGAYDDRESFIDHVNGERLSLYGIVEGDLAPRTTLSVGAGYQKRDWLPAFGGLPRYADGSDLGLPRSTFLSTPWTYWDFETTQVFAELSHGFGEDWTIKVSAVGDHETSDLKYGYTRGAVNAATLAGPRLMGGANAYENDQLALDAYLTGSFQALGGRHDLVLGANWYDRDAESWGGTLRGLTSVPVNVFDPNPEAIPDPGAPTWTSKSLAKTRQYGVYGSLRLRPVEPLAVILGGRMSWWETSSENLLTGVVSSDYEESGQFTPYAGIVYDLDRTWSVYASYADIFRAQSNLRDSDGEALPPVSGANYEAGLKGSFAGGRLNSALSLFRIQETNRAIQVSDTVVGGCCYATNGKVRSQGVDGELSGEVLPGWQLGAGYTHNTSKYLEDPVYQGQPFRTASPKHMFRLWTSYNLPDQWNAWTVGGGVNMQSKFYTAGGTPSVRVEQGGYAIANLRVGYRINQNWSAALNVNNLFDRTYYTRLGSANFGPSTMGNVYGEPRNAMLTLRTRF